MEIYEWILEFFCWLTNAITYFLPFLKPGDPIPNPTQTETIIILSPSLTGPILYLKEKKYLEKHGFRTIVIDLAPYMKDIDNASKMLKKHIEKLNLEHICLVGVSAAGLVAYEYLNVLFGWKYVDTFIAVATPFKGSPMAYFAYIDRAGRQLIPNSKFIQKINEITPGNLDKTYCVIAKKDELVPSKSSQLYGAHIVNIPIIGHVRLHAYSTKTFDTIIKIAKGEY